MKNRLVNSVANAKVANQVVTLKGPALIREILFTYIGTNKVGHTASMAEHMGGHLRINEAGGSGMLGDIVSLIRPQFFLTFWEAFQGWFYEVSVDDGDYVGVLPVPLHAGDNDDNAYFLPAGYSLEIQVPTMDAGDTELDHVHCEVDVTLSDRNPMGYVPRIFQRRIDLGAVGQDPIAENTAVMIATSATDTDPDRISVMRGSDRRHYLGRAAAYAVYQTLMHMEAAPTMAGDIVYDFTDMGTDRTELIGGGNMFEVLNGVGYLSLMTYAMDMHHTDRMAAADEYIRAATGELAVRARQVGISSTAVSAVAATSTALPGFSGPRQRVISPRTTPRRMPRIRGRRATRSNGERLSSGFTPLG